MAMEQLVCPDIAPLSRQSAVELAKLVQSG